MRLDEWGRLPHLLKGHCRHSSLESIVAPMALIRPSTLVTQYHPQSNCGGVGWMVLDEEDNALFLVGSRGDSRLVKTHAHHNSTIWDVRWLNWRAWLWTRVCTLRCEAEPSDRGGKGFAVLLTLHTSASWLADSSHVIGAMKSPRVTACPCRRMSAAGPTSRAPTE